MMGIAFSMSAFAYILFYPLGPGYISPIEWAPLSNVSISNPVNNLFVYLFGIFNQIVSANTCNI